MKARCIHGRLVLNEDDGEPTEHCGECEAIGRSPTYNPNVTAQELEAILCDEPMIVSKQ